MQEFKKIALFTLALLGVCGVGFAADPTLVPLSKRTGKISKVYFTRDISPKGLEKIYKYVGKDITDKVAVKLHTGEPHGPNFNPPSLVEPFLATVPNSTIVETNTYYEGGRYTTAQHRKTIKTNGWTWPIDIMDEHGAVMLPVKNGHVHP